MQRDGHDYSGLGIVLRVLSTAMPSSVSPAEQNFNRQPRPIEAAKASDRRPPIPSSNSGMF